MIDLQKLRLFVQVAEAGSLTKAGVILNTVQPVLSRQISNLELDIGGRLFVRNGRGVELSELGEMLMPRVKALLQESDALWTDAKMATGHVSGEVRVGMLASFSGTLGIELLTRMAAAYPSVRVKVFEGTIGRIDEWLDDGRIDISVNYRDSQIALADEQPLGSVETFLVGPQDDPLLARDSINFKELDGLPLILSATPSGLRIALDNLAVKVGIDLNNAFEVDSVVIHLELARRGLGYAIMTPQAILMKLQESNLSYARIVNPSIFRQITVGSTLKRNPNTATRQALKIIAEIGQELVSSGVWSTSSLTGGVRDEEQDNK